MSEGRNQAAYRHSADLVRDFGLSIDEAWPLLAAWNDKNTPPLAESELRECLTKAHKYGTHSVGEKANRRMPHAGTQNQPTDTLPEALQWRPFPLKVLPEPLRQYVVEGSKAMGCHPSMIALPALAAIASAIGTTRRIQLKNTWREPAIVWSAIIAESGTLKSPAQEYALRPLMRLQADMFREYKDAAAEHETDTLRYEKELATWKRSKAGGDPPEKPDDPRCKRLVCADVTIEALAPILEVNGRGVLVARDELSEWLGGFNQYKSGKGGDVSAWLESHRAGSFTIDRKTGQRITYVPRAAISICGTIQPGTLRRSLGREHFENGLAARLLLSMPPSRRKKWTEADISRRTVEAFADMLGRLREFRHAADENGEPIPIDVPLSREGRTAWIRFYNEHAARESDAHGDLAAMFSKLEGYAERLALIFHCVRAAMSPDFNGDEIGPDCIERGAKLAEWFCHEGERIYGIFSESDEDRESRELVEYVRSRGGSVTVRDLQRGPRRFRGTADAIRERLAELVRDGLGLWEYPPPGSEGGRSPATFRLTGDTTGGLRVGYSGYGDTTTAGDRVNGGSVTVASVTTPEGRVAL